MSEVTTINQNQFNIVSYIEAEPAKIKYDIEIIKKAVAIEVEKIQATPIESEKDLKDVKAQVNGRIKTAQDFAIELERKAKEQITEFRSVLKECIQPLVAIQTDLTTQWQENEANRLAAKKLEINAIRAELLAEVALDKEYQSQMVFNEKWNNKGCKPTVIREEMSANIQLLLSQQNARKMQIKAREQLVENLNLKYGIIFTAEAFPIDNCRDEEIEPNYIKAIEKQHKAQAEAEAVLRLKARPVDSPIKVEQPKAEQPKVEEPSMKVAEQTADKIIIVANEKQVEELKESTGEIYSITINLNKSDANFSSLLKTLTAFIKSKNLDFTIKG